MSATGGLLNGLKAGAACVASGSKPPLPSWVETHKIQKYSQCLDTYFSKQTAWESFGLVVDDLCPRDAEEEEEARILQEVLQRSLVEYCDSAYDMTPSMPTLEPAAPPASDHSSGTRRFSG